MKKIVPEMKIMPFWIYFLLQCILFSIIVYTYFVIKDNNMQYDKLTIVIIYIWAFLSCAIKKMLSTYTPVDTIKLDTQNHQITITYYAFFISKRQLSISFDELTYKISNDSMLFGLATSIRFYIPNQKKYKVKLNHRNGWTRNQIKEVIAELQKHPEIKQLKGWYSI